MKVSYLCEYVAKEILEFSRYATCKSEFIAEAVKIRESFEPELTEEENSYISEMNCAIMNIYHDDIN